jgi:glycosyltransferase involved in cell wall biosynthesis
VYKSTLPAMTPRDLIVFTIYYPYGDADSYLDEEIRILAESFRRVFVISGERAGRPARPHPGNVTPVRFTPRRSSMARLASLRFLAYRDFHAELRYARQRRPQIDLVSVSRYAAEAMWRGHRYLSAIRRLFTRHGLVPKDTVIYNYWMEDHAYASCLFKREHPATVVVSRAHSSDLFFERSAIGYLPLRRRTFEELDALFFISEQGRVYFRTLHEVPVEAQHKLRLARLGVPDCGTSPPAPDPAALRVVSSAHIRPLKRLDLIARALRLCPEIAIEWVHFGDCYGDVAAFRAFEAQLRQILAASPHVRLQLRGHQPPSVIRQYYRENTVDLLINVSSTEGLPVSIMEAMSAGIPALATAVGGNPEIVNNDNGILLPADPTPDEVAAALRRFHACGADRRESYRRFARATWATDFDSSRNYARFAAALTDLFPSRQD